MKANELRIGNLVWLKCHHHPVSVEQIYKDDIDELVWIATDLHEGESLEDYDPIPLTEEWLVKFGFETVSYGFMFPKIEGSEYHRKIGRWITKKSFQEDVLLEHPFLRYDGLCDVHYVHQLQNLYFALTGEELTLK